MNPTRADGEEEQRPGYRYRIKVVSRRFEEEQRKNLELRSSHAPGDNSWKKLRFDEAREKMNLTPKQRQFLDIDHGAYEHIVEFDRSAKRVWYLTLAQAAIFVLLIWSVAAHHCLYVKPLRSSGEMGSHGRALEMQSAIQQGGNCSSRFDDPISKTNTSHCSPHFGMTNDADELRYLQNVTLE